MKVGKYWNDRYKRGRSSGAGSEGVEALSKAITLRNFIKFAGPHSVIDWGVGDGHVLQLTDTRVPYVGVDLSHYILDNLVVRFKDDPTKLFVPYQDAFSLTADLSISFDTLFHQVNDNLYDEYLEQVFRSGERFVLVYSTNYNSSGTARHVKHRRWTIDVEERFPEWGLAFADEGESERDKGFYTYYRRTND